MDDHGWPCFVFQLIVLFHVRGFGPIFGKPSAAGVGVFQAQCLICFGVLIFHSLATLECVGISYIIDSPRDRTTPLSLVGVFLDMWYCVLIWNIRCSCFSVKNVSFAIFTPLKTNMSPENQWLEDVFPTEVAPFFFKLGYIRLFQGCNCFCWSQNFSTCDASLFAGTGTWWTTLCYWRSTQGRQGWCIFLRRMRS